MLNNDFREGSKKNDRHYSFGEHTYLNRSLFFSKDIDEQDYNYDKLANGSKDTIDELENSKEGAFL